MRSLKSILKYAKERAEVLGSQIDYYDNKERLGSYLTNDQAFSYSIAQARLNEIEKFIRFLESE